MTLQRKTDLFILGFKPQVTPLRELFGGLPYFNLLPNEALLKLRNNQKFFVIIVCDFQRSYQMRAVSRIFSRIIHPGAKKFLCVVNPQTLGLAELFFAHEVGCEYVAFGPQREFTLRTLLKREALNEDYDPKLNTVEDGVQKACLMGDEMTLKKTLKKLVESEKDNDKTLRILSIASEGLRLYKKTLHYLKERLALNPQNIFAINDIYKIGLKTHEFQDVLKIVDQHSDYKNQMIINLVDAPPPSFSLHGLLNRGMSESLLGFINLRAILAMKTYAYKEALALYQLALDGSNAKTLNPSKVHYNMGLCLLKMEEREKAAEHLNQSLNLGQGVYIKAKYPLFFLTTMAARSRDSKTSPANSPYPASQPAKTTDFELDES